MNKRKRKSREPDCLLGCRRTGAGLCLRRDRRLSFLPRAGLSGPDRGRVLSARRGRCGRADHRGREPLARRGRRHGGRRHRGPCHGDAERALPHPQPARLDPDDDRALLGEPARHGQAERRADQCRDDDQPVFRPRPARLLRPPALRRYPGGRRRHRRLAVPGKRRRPFDARDRGECPHGPRAGRRHQPPDLSRHRALQRAGRPRRRALCPDERLCRRHLWRRHHCRRPCRRHHRRDAVRRPRHPHGVDWLRARLDSLPHRHPACLVFRCARPPGFRSQFRDGAACHRGARSAAPSPRGAA